MATKKSDLDLIKAQKRLDSANKQIENLQKQRQKLEHAEVKLPPEYASLEKEIYNLEKEISKVSKSIQDQIDIGARKFNVERVGKEWLDTAEGQRYKSELQKLKTEKDSLTQQLTTLVNSEIRMREQQKAQQIKLDAEMKEQHAAEIKALDSQIAAEKNKLQKARTMVRAIEGDLKRQERIMRQQSVASRLSSLNSPAAIKQRMDAAARLQREEQNRQFKMISDQKRINQIMRSKNGSSMKPGEAFGLKGFLDTGIKADGSRAHDMYYIDAKGQKHRRAFGKDFTTVSHYADFLKSGWGQPLDAKTKAMMDWAGRFGTTHHKLIEDYYNKAFGKGAKVLKEDDILKHATKLYGNAVKNNDKETLADLSVLMSNGKFDRRTLGSLTRTVNDFIKYADEAQLDPSQILTEKTLAAVIKTPKGRMIPLGGTIDQLWFNKNMGKYILSDAKTNSTLSPAMGMQTSLYNMLLRLSGFDVDSNMKIINTPRVAGKPGMVANVEAMSDAQLLEYLDKIEDIKELSDPQDQRKAQQILMKEFGTGGLGLPLQKMADSKSASGYKYSIGGKSIYQWSKEPNGIQNMINSLASEDDRNHIRNLMYYRKGAEPGGFTYKGEAFDAYRRAHRPELYNIGSPEWMKKFGGLDEGTGGKARVEGGGVEEGMAGEARSLVGGMSLTDWVNYIGTFKDGSKEQGQAIDTMLSILNRTAVGAGQREASQGWAHDVYWSREFLKGMGTAGDDENNEVIQAILNRASHFKNVSEVLSTMGKAGDSLGLGQRYTPRESLALQKFQESVTPRQAEEVLYEDIAKYSHHNGREISGVEDQQIANRLAQLFLASDYYDRVYDIDNSYDQWKKAHPGTKMTRDQYARVLMEKSGSGQWAQYESSRKAATWYKEHRDMFAADPQGFIPGIKALANMPSDVFGTDAFNLMQSIKQAEMDSPSILAFDPKDPTNFFTTFLNQMQGKKIAWWDNLGYDTLIKAGFRIKPRTWKDVRTAADTQSEFEAGAHLGEWGDKILQYQKELDFASPEEEKALLTKIDINKYKLKSNKADRESIIQALKLIRSGAWDVIRGEGGIGAWDAKYDALTKPDWEEVPAGTWEDYHGNALPEPVQEAIEETVVAAEEVKATSSKKKKGGRKKGTGRKTSKEFKQEIQGTTEQINDAQAPQGAAPTQINATVDNLDLNNANVVIQAENVYTFGEKGNKGSGSGSGDGSDDKKSDAQIKREADKKAKAEAQAKIKAEREYASLMKQRNQLLGSNQGLEYALNNKGAMPGAGFRNRGAPLTKEQKQGYAEMIGINKEKLGSVNQRLAALRAGGLISDEALAKMDADAALNLRALQAQAKMNGGGGSGGGFLGGRTLFGSLKESLGNMVQWSLSISLAYKILGAFTKGLQKAIQAVQTMDSAMMNLRIVTGASKEDASALISGYAKLADQLSVTTSEVTQSAAAWMRQGYSIQETGELIKASMYLAKLGFTDVNTATSVLTSTLKGFKLQASDAVSIVDKLTKLDMSAAITATDIGQGLAQFAATGSLAGLTTDQAAALVTTIADVSQKSGSEVGNALNFSRGSQI